MSQKEIVLDYLRKHGRITKFIGFAELGITKTDTIISKLRKDGHKITSTDTKTKNRYGRNTHYFTYYLQEEK